MNRLQNKTAVIVGGAGGVGHGIALRFAREGARVVVIDVRKLVADAELNIESVTVDVTDKNALNSAISKAGAANQRIDILVNAVEDHSSPSALQAQNDAEWTAQFNATFNATRWAMQSAYPLMRDHGGYIINVVSSYGITVWGGMAAYQAASESIKALTRSAAQEWGPQGIRVNAILPTADTEHYRQLRAAQPDAADRIVQNTPLMRMGNVERDIGGAAMLLVTEAGRYLTGHMIHADGGQHLTPSPYEALLPS